MSSVHGSKPASASNSANPALRRDLFTRVAGWTIRATGGRWGFLIALGAVVLWGVTGPFFHYSENWQLVINTGTTIVTFLMVFLIQNAQNRESKAIHLKLDELILRFRSARNEMIDIERLTDDQLERLGERYSKVAEANQHKLKECFGQTEREGRKVCRKEHDAAERQGASPEMVKAEGSAVEKRPSVAANRSKSIAGG